MLEGQEVVVPCMVDGDKNAIQLRTARLQRMKASLKIQDYDPKRDFAGWGVEEFRAIAGMPAFTHYAPLARTDPGAGRRRARRHRRRRQARLLPLRRQPRRPPPERRQRDERDPPAGPRRRRRGAAWGDYNGDGKPDLLLATPTGPRLFTNLGKGNFRDDTAAMPRQAYDHLTACAWIDQDGDGKPDILLADGFSGLRLYHNLGVPASPRRWNWRSASGCSAARSTTPRGKGFDIAYPPEKKIDLAADYPGKNDQKATWKDSPVQDGQVTSVKIYRDQDHANMVIYLYREVVTNREVELPISLGNGGPLVVWVNGAKALSDNTQRHRARPGEGGAQAQAGEERPADQGVLRRARPGILLQLDETRRRRRPADVRGRLRPRRPRHRRDCRQASKATTSPSSTSTATAGRTSSSAAGTGVLVLNTPKGFVEAKDSGLSFRTGKVIPAFGDFDGDRKPDLFVPQSGGAVQALPRRRRPGTSPTSPPNQVTWPPSRPRPPAPPGSTSTARAAPACSSAA